MAAQGVLLVSGTHKKVFRLASRDTAAGSCFHFIPVVYRDWRSDSIKMGDYSVVVPVNTPVAGNCLLLLELQRQAQRTPLPWAWKAQAGAGSGEQGVNCSPQGALCSPTDRQAHHP